MDYFKMSATTNTEERAFSYAVTIGLVRVKPKQCQRCSSKMHPEKGKVRHGVNCHRFCNNNRCNNAESLYTNTIFNRTHLKMSALLK
jgi:hypothetical protein